MTYMTFFNKPLLMITLLAPVGCGARVIFENNDAGHGGAGGAGGAGGDCVLLPPPPEFPLAKLDSLTSGVFIGGYLHLAGRLDGEERYVVLEIGQKFAWVVDTPTNLLGPANLAAASPGKHARLRVTNGVVAVDVIDTTSPGKPILKQTTELLAWAEVPPAWQTVFSVVDDHLLFCFQGSPNPEPTLHSYPLDGSQQPFSIATGLYGVCSGIHQDRGSAKGKTWMSWGLQSNLFIYDATATDAVKIAEYQYNPDGIHAYGAVLSAATDGERIVFDPASESEFFLYSIGSSADIITHTVFGVKGPKRLLGVVDHIAYLATPEGVRAYDVSVIGPPTDWDSHALLDYHADIPLGSDLAQLIAADDAYLAIVDGAGRLYLVPRATSGPVSPLQVFLGPPPGTSGHGCE
jgi:hypothetical protein